MKAIVIYKKFHDMDIYEIMPRVFLIKEENPEDELRRIWEDNYNGAIADNLYFDGNDPLDEENCWFEEDIAQIAWADGDVMEFYVVDVEEYK